MLALVKASGFFFLYFPLKMYYGFSHIIRYFRLLLACKKLSHSDIQLINQKFKSVAFKAYNENLYKSLVFLLQQNPGKLSGDRKF
jgi:hypothetical protein